MEPSDSTDGTTTTAPRTDAAPAGPRTRATRPSWRRRGRALAPYAVFLVLAATLVGWHMHKYPWLSPTDENVHFDYIRILPHVPYGEPMSQDALRMTACRKYDPNLYDHGLAIFKWPPCNSKHFDPAQFPGGGPSSAGSTAPFYYVVTAALTRPIAYVVDVPLILLVRAAGALWLTALMSVSYLVARRIRVPALPAAGAAVLVGSSSDVLTAASTAGPDVAAAVTGGFAVLAALAWQPTRRSTAWFLLAVAVASLTKLTDFTGVGVAVLVLLGKAVVARRAREAGAVKAVVTAAAASVVFVALSAAWFYRPKPSLAPLAGAAAAPPAAPVVVPWHDLKAVILFNFWPPNQTNYNATFLDGVFNNHLEGTMAGLMVFGVLVAILAVGRQPMPRALGIGLLVMVVVGPVALTLLNAYAYNQWFILPSRYGYGLLVPLTAAMAWALRRGATGRAMALLGLVGYLSVFF